MMSGSAPIPPMYPMAYNVYMKKPRPHPEMIEGPEAFERFRQAAKIALAMPKAALPPDPFKKPQAQLKRKRSGHS